MRKKAIVPRLAILWLALVVAGSGQWIGPSTAQAQGSITFSDAETENNFPEGLTFTITVESGSDEIVSASLFHVMRNAPSTTQEILSIEAGQRMRLEYTWDTGDITVPPSAPIHYYWEVTDSAGNRVQSEEMIVFYDDVNFNWQILEDENIAVWWHDRPESFGERVFEIAVQAFNSQQRLFAAELDLQIRIIIYNAFEEFAAWHSFIGEWVGGQAFTSVGVTAQIVGAYSNEDQWLRDVIPHEISHLYLYQATFHPLSSVPAWLNEGLAQYHEFDIAYWTADMAEDRIREGGLLPLWSLTGSFGNDEDEVRQAYAESLSAVIYMVERYGESGVARLLEAYKRGLSEDEAFIEALGLTQMDFQQGWLAWLNIPLELYPTPTPEAALVLPTPPPMAQYPTPKPSNTPEAVATDTPEATETSAPTPIPDEGSATSVPPTKAAPTAPLESEGDADREVSDNGATNGGSSICAAAVLPVAVLGFFFARPWARPLGRGLTRKRKLGR